MATPPTPAPPPRTRRQRLYEIIFEHDTSIYFNGPDGERLELLADSLGEMYGADVS